jgi:hypothetical protein
MGAGNWSAQDQTLRLSWVKLLGYFFTPKTATCVAISSFCGYGLDDTIPDHRILSKARKRWGQEVFMSLFSQVVAQCVSAGLIDGSKIHVGSSLVDANASLNSVRELDAATLDQIQRACLEQTEKLEEADCPEERYQ